MLKYALLSGNTLVIPNLFYIFALKVTKTKRKYQQMELKKLKTQSLNDALREMNIGETCIAPDEVSVAHVKRTCSELKSEGYLFATSQRTGVQTITRLK